MSEKITQYLRSNIASQPYPITTTMMTRAIGSISSLPSFSSSPLLYSSSSLTYTSQGILESCLQYVGPIVALALQYHLLKSSTEIIANKSTSNHSSLPYTAMFMNSLVWMMYGFLKRDDFITFPNIFGLIVSSICIAIYQFYHLFGNNNSNNNNGSSSNYSNKSQLYNEYKLIVLSIITTGILLYSYQNIHYLGLFGSLLLVVLVSSPLMSVYRILTVQEKSIGEIQVPFSISLTLWIHSLSWMTYGAVLVRDPFIYGPNILGLMISTLQLLVCVLLSSAQK